MIIKYLNKFFKNTLENRYANQRLVLVIDLIIVIFASVLSYLIVAEQFYRNINVTNHPKLSVYLTITFFFNALFFLILKTYKGIIRYSTIRELQRVFLALASSCLSMFLTFHYGLKLSGSVSLAYCSMFFLIGAIGLNTFRAAVIYIYQRLLRLFGTNRPIQVYIWGANDSDLSIAQQINSSGNSFHIKGFILKEYDSKIRKLVNLPILTIKSLDDLNKYKIDSVLFTDSAVLREESEFIEAMLSIDIKIYLSQINNFEQINNIKDTLHEHIRPIQIEDLLGRPEINISLEAISHNVNNKTILVTGAAGSIGSEIVRQLSNFSPSCIICLDQAETPLNELDLELKKYFPSINFVTIIGDIRNKYRMSLIFEKYKPQIVYHAAAYKHVPMMEKFPCESVITNVLGTKQLVDLSINHSVEMFVMISTDKAVNPTNIMGATKRIAEIYVQSSAMDRIKNKSNTKFVTTRFGNVLGSNGSVIPLFKKQIEKGGPITVTHPEITRYFMTIPEACRLVLEASVIGKSGYIYVFDMGDPVKIISLAKKMIELAGFIPGKDIKIEYSGLRPGEKLYEELLNDSEVSVPTSHKKVMMAKVREYEFSEVLPNIDNIILAAENGEDLEMVTLMKQLVPEFISNNSEFEKLDKKNKVSVSLN